MSVVQLLPFPAGITGADLADLTITDGVWCWFSDPRGISIDGRALIGSINAAGDVQTHHVTSGAPTVVNLASAYEADDHDNPAFLRRNSDGKIMAFYSKHNGLNPRIQISTNADDPSSWTAAVNPAGSWGLTQYSYAHPFQLLDEASDPLYFFFRAQAGDGTKAIHLSKSTDDGATWPTPTRIVAGTYYYVKMAQFGGGRIGMAISQHPQDATELPVPAPPGVSGRSSLYYIYYEGGTWQEIGGSPLTLPIDPTTLTPIWNGTSNSADAWAHELQFDGSGHPVIAYATYTTPYNPRYRYARHTGTVWDDHEIASGGDNVITPFNDTQPYYTGGLCIDPDNTNIVYFGQLYIENWRMMRGVTSDGGTSWTFTVKDDSANVVSTKLMRPFVVPGQVAEPRLVYLKGPYRNFLSPDYDTDIVLKSSDAGTTPDTPGDFAVRRVALRREAGTQEVVIPGYGTPTGVWFELTTGDMIEGNFHNDHSGSYGAYDGTSQGCVAWRTTHGDQKRRGSTAHVAMAWFRPTSEPSGPTITVAATALINGGVKFTVVNTGGTPAALTVMMTKAPNVKVGTVQFQTQNNTRIVTPGFKMNALLMASHQDVFDNANKSLAIVSRGYGSWDDVSIGQASQFYRRETSTPVAGSGEVRESILTFPGVPTPSRYVELASVTVTTFGLTSRGGDLSAGYGLYMAIGGVNAYADLFNMPTATGAATFGAAAFTPEIAMLAPTMLDTVGVREDTGKGSAWGSVIFTEQAIAGLNWFDQDNVALASANDSSRSQNYLRLTDHTGAVEFVADTPLFASGSAGLTFSDANGTTRKMPGLLIAP